MLDYKDYIYAIYQYKSFSKAAKMLHVSQPWLSTAVKKTEMELQLSLFDRSTSPVSLTEAGRYYIEQIKKINAIEEEMRRAFEQMHERSGIPLRIRRMKSRRSISAASARPLMLKDRISI